MEDIDSSLLLSSSLLITVLKHSRYSNLGESNYELFDSNIMDSDPISSNQVTMGRPFHVNIDQIINIYLFIYFFLFESGHHVYLPLVPLSLSNLMLWIFVFIAFLVVDAYLPDMCTSCPKKLNCPCLGSV